MIYRTADEALANYKLALGEDFGVLYYHLHQYFRDTVIIWDQHETLFGSQERVELMNETGPALAYNIERLFLQSVVSGIARLIDPEKSIGRSNLTIKSLPKHCSTACTLAIEPLIKRIETDFAKLKEVRNKILAHNDYELATEKSAPLNYGTRAEITQLLKTIHSIFEAIEGHYFNSSFALLPLGNEDSFAHLHFLQRGRAAKATELEKVKNGSINWQDIEKIEPWLQEDKNEARRYDKSK
jgi:hypothetical protein